MDEDIQNLILKSRGGGNKCGRWNPTTEQMRVLTDLFRSGLRTPNTDEIQKISSQLSIYGKVESKNVFYWFQNHKARERQKRRRVSVVDDNQQKENRRHDKKESSSLSSHFPDINEVQDGEKVKETLQLFPLNSFNKLESEKLRMFTDDQRNGIPSFSYDAIIGAHEMMHPTLDLCLSFL